MTPCNLHPEAGRNRKGQCLVCRRTKEALRRVQSPRGTCHKCGQWGRALSPTTRVCMRGCDVGRRQDNQHSAQLAGLHEHLLSLLDRQWQASMSWERQDIAQEIARTQARIARLEADARPTASARRTPPGVRQ